MFLVKNNYQLSAAKERAIIRQLPRHLLQPLGFGRKCGMARKAHTIVKSFELFGICNKFCIFAVGN